MVITEKIKVCPICKGPGILAYKELTDRLFDAPGNWNFNECLNKSCAILWLDPMPSEADLKMAYSNYLTHMSDIDVESSNQTIKFIYEVNREYIKYKFGKYSGKYRLSFLVLDLLYYIHPLKKTVNKVNAIYLGQKKIGKLLDIGCGQGDFLFRMRELGWEVSGVDTDKMALNFALQKKLDVFHYNSKELKYPANTFDLITLNHVFEHMNNLGEIFAEIYRILKSGGNLVIITPNKNSISHRLFKENWRGLEPPRHLHIMTGKSLRRFLMNEGFTYKLTFNRVASYSVVEQSYLLMKDKKKLSQVEKYLLRVLIHIYAMISHFRNDLGDFIYIVMSK